MARRIAVTSLNATTLDIINTIRANASYEYQQSIPAIESEADIPKVGELLYGYPSLANQFINSLVNRIAAVRVNSAVFNNEYKDLKKGVLEYGETVEEVFVAIAKAREFSVEKAASREFKRTLPDVKTAFHVMNWRVQYPITIQDEDLRMAFTSSQGVQDLIARIVDQVYTAAEYDEFLLFKYLLIKGVNSGALKPVYFDSGDIKNAAVAFRGTSNLLTFMKKEYNAAGVTTATPKADQYIFMDANFNAQFDVNVLSAAFNMDKADFMGKLKLIDDFTTFDNERFAEIREASDMVEEVTSAELSAMSGIKAILVDREWFQIYDNLNKFTECYVSSGLYWNYNYHVWKTVSYSPFSNAVAFVAGSAASPTASYTLTIDTVSHMEDSDGHECLMFTLTGGPDNIQYVNNTTNIGNGIATKPYGAYIVPLDGYFGNHVATNVVIKATVNDVGYTVSGGVDVEDVAVGATLTLAKDA